MTTIDQNSRQGGRRETYLMGMLIVFGLVFFHSAQIFSGGDFYVVNTQQSGLADLAANLLLAFANMWGMPLMMFIAGSAVWFSLRKRTLGQFLLNRVHRLVIPFITGMVLIFPPQVWIGIKFPRASKKCRGYGTVVQYSARALRKWQPCILVQ